MFLVTRNGVFGDADFELKRLNQLCSDLTAIADGYQPGKELVNAPFLDDYAPGFRWDPCLTGKVQGHPLLGDRAVQTSGLWAYAPDLGWARTLSRFYRLGYRKAGEGSAL